MRLRQGFMLNCIPYWKVISIALLVTSSISDQLSRLTNRNLRMYLAGLFIMVKSRPQRGWRYHIHITGVVGNRKKWGLLMGGVWKDLFHQLDLPSEENFPLSCGGLKLTGLLVFVGFSCSSTQVVPWHVFYYWKWIYAYFDYYWIAWKHIIWLPNI